MGCQAPGLDSNPAAFASLSTQATCVRRLIFREVKFVGVRRRASHGPRDRTEWDFREHSMASCVPFDCNTPQILPNSPLIAGAGRNLGHFVDIERLTFAAAAKNPRRRYNHAEWSCRFLQITCKRLHVWNKRTEELIDAKTRRWNTPISE